MVRLFKGVRSFSTAAVIFSVGLVLQGCGGDGPASPSTDSAPASPAPAPVPGSPASSSKPASPETGPGSASPETVAPSEPASGSKPASPVPGSASPETAAPREPSSPASGGQPAASETAASSGPRSNPASPVPTPSSPPASPETAASIEPGSKSASSVPAPSSQPASPETAASGTDHKTALYNTPRLQVIVPVPKSGGPKFSVKLEVHDVNDPDSTVEAAWKDWDMMDRHARFPYHGDEAEFALTFTKTGFGTWLTRGAECRVQRKVKDIKAPDSVQEQAGEGDCAWLGISFVYSELGAEDLNPFETLTVNTAKPAADLAAMTDADGVLPADGSPPSKNEEVGGATAASPVLLATLVAAALSVAVAAAIAMRSRTPKARELQAEGAQTELRLNLSAMHP